jgi:DNA-binding NarL/FixJ family response regulator
VILEVVPAFGSTRRRTGPVLTYDEPTNAIALTPRQWEVLRLLLQGMRVPMIASMLEVSRSTVRNHLATIFQKCGVHSQSELIAFFRDRAPITVDYDGHSEVIWDQ